MTVSQFSTIVTKLEGLKVHLSVAQVAEVLRCANQALDGQFYPLIRKCSHGKKAKKSRTRTR